MNFTEMTVEQLEARKAAIATECEAENADVDALLEEIKGINTELETRKSNADKKAELRSQVAMGAGEVVSKNEVDTMNNKEEVRNSKAYIDAFAKYIKTGKDDECRALLTVNATDSSASITGYVPVPDLVAEVVTHAWDKAEIMNLVKKTNLKGNVQVGFELSADGAVIHNEGAEAPDEEEITLGIITMIPKAIKKWLTVSDESIDLNGEEFIRYIYSELTYRIAKKAEDTLVGMIAAADDESTSTSVGVPQVATAPVLGAIAAGMAELTDEASNLVVVTTRANWALFKAAQYNANFAMDIFEGLKVYFNDTLEDFATGAAGDVYAIIGDFASGAQANFPNGNEIKIKVDDLSLAEDDLVKFVGREFVGLGLIAERRFVNLVIPSGE